MLGVGVALLLMRVSTVAAAAVFAVCALWGVCATSFNVAFQAEVIRMTPPSASAVAMSIFSGLFNLGIGCGSWIGGMVTSGLGISLVGFVGAAFALTGFAICCTALSRAFK